MRTLLPHLYPSGFALLLMALTALQLDVQARPGNAANPASPGMTIPPAENEKVVASKIDQVVVFQAGAQVRRTAEVTLVPGVMTLVFSNLSPSVNPGIVRITGDGPFEVLSTSHRFHVDTISGQSSQAARERLIKQREELNDRINVVSGKGILYDREEQLLLNNQSFLVKDSGVDLQRLIDANRFFNERFAAIHANRAALDKEIKGLQEQILALDKELAALPALLTKSTLEMLVRIDAQQAGKGALMLSYWMPNATWTPSYNARVKDLKMPLQLEYQAMVYNSTGEDWKQVALSISTGAPSANRAKPQLSPYNLSFMPISPAAAFRPNLNQPSLFMDAARPSQVEALSSRGRADEEMDYRGNLAYTPVTVSESPTQTRFDVSGRQDITADGLQHSVRILNHSLNVEYLYQCTPKLDPQVYLTALLTDWEKLDLISGPMHIYFEDDYMGESLLQLGFETDTMAISLGADPNIQVRRKRTLREDDSNLTGSKKKFVRQYEFTVTNRKKAEIHIQLDDQVPIANNEEIEITHQKLDNGKLNAGTGIVMWDFRVAPGKTERRELKYTVQAPRELNLQVE